MYSLPDDENLDVRNMSKTRQLNYNTNVKSVHFVCSHYIGMSQCTVQKTLNANVYKYSRHSGY